MLLYVLAIALAKGRRRRAVIWMGTSFIVVALLVLITSSLGSHSGRRRARADERRSVQPSPISTTSQSSCSTAWPARCSSPASSYCSPRWSPGRTSGRSPCASSSRRTSATTSGLSIAAALLLFLILLWIVPVNGFRTAVGLTINIALAIAGFIALVRITRHEFPDAAPADFGAAGDWVEEAVGLRHRLRQGADEQDRDAELPRRRRQDH